MHANFVHLTFYFALRNKKQLKNITIMKTMNLITIENQNMSATTLNGAGAMADLTGRNLIESINLAVKKLQSRILTSKAVTILTLIVSICLGEEVAPARSLSLTNVLVSGLSAFLFGGFSLAIQLLLLAWFALSIVALRK